MEETASFAERLEVRLQQKESLLERNALPALKSTFRVYQTLFENLYNLLIRKSLLREDPYRYERKASELALPPTGVIMASDKQEQLSRRLSEYHVLLDHLNSSGSFSLEFFSMERIKKVLAIAQFIQWQRFSETSTNMTTAVLAEFLGRIRQGSDSLSTSIINDSLSQIQRAAARIVSFLKEITAYRREEYKLKVRRQVLFPPETPVAGEKSPRELLEAAAGDEAGKEERLKLAKRLFRERTRNEPFYPELVEEILAEEFSEQAASLREAVLGRLAPPAEKLPEKKKEPETRPMLLEAIKLMAQAAAPLADCLRKLTDNRDLLDSRRKSLGERFREWVEKAVQKKNPPRIVEIEYLDASMSVPKEEKIDLNLFLQTLQKKAQLFSSLASRTSTAARKLEQAKEEPLFEFLDRNLQEVKLIFLRLQGLDAYFRSEAKGEERSLVKTIKIELLSLQNHYLKANKKRHDYVAYQEERQQLRRLGIEPAAS